MKFHQLLSDADKRYCKISVYIQYIYLYLSIDVDIYIKSKRWLQSYKAFLNLWRENII